jgi:hypothetical protein
MLLVPEPDALKDVKNRVTSSSRRALIEGKAAVSI